MRVFNVPKNTFPPQGTANSASGGIPHNSGVVVTPVFGSNGGGMTVNKMPSKLIRPKSPVRQRFGVE